MSEKSSDRFGLVVGALSGDQLDAMNIDGGVLVREVTANSAGSRAGIRAQDVIVSINGVELDSVADFNTQLNGVEFLALEVPGPQG